MFVLFCLMVDRLWVYEFDGVVIVLNFLSGLLVIVGVELIWEDDSYVGLVEIIVKGKDYYCSFLINKGFLIIYYFENIVVNSEGMKILFKK